MAPVSIEATAAGVARRVASRISTRLTEATVRRGAAVVALTGGRSIGSIYRLLAGTGRTDPGTTALPAPPWGTTHVCWTDERCVPVSHQDSNYGMAVATLLSQVAVPDRNIHRIEGERPAADAAQRYDDVLRHLRRSLGRERQDLFDLTVLSLGEDAHIASLFPNQRWETGPEALAAPAFPAQAPHDRVTLTPGALAASGTILVLATGALKAPAVAAVFAREGSVADTPGRLLLALGSRVEWVMDAAAARGLSGPTG